MSGLQTQDFSSALRLSKPPKEQQPTETKPKKKICCACPDTKKLRDECVVEHGESACSKWIEAHRVCLRAEGFNVWLFNALMIYRLGEEYSVFFPFSFRELYRLCCVQVQNKWILIDYIVDLQRLILIFICFFLFLYNSSNLLIITTELLICYLWYDLGTMSSHCAVCFYFIDYMYSWCGCGSHHNGCLNRA